MQQVIEIAQFHLGLIISARLQCRALLQLKMRHVLALLKELGVKLILQLIGLYKSILRIFLELV